MKNIKITLILVFLAVSNLMAQTMDSDHNFQRPLIEVLQNMETQFNVKIKYSEKDLKDLKLDNADWRIRPWDVELSLKNVLGTFDLVANPDGENTYKVENFRRHRRTVEEAQQFLDYLTTQYDDKASWEARRNELKKEIRKAVRLDEAPEAPGTKPIFTKERKLNGYTTQNFALETMPGVYVCGTIYRPAKIKGKAPLMMCPIGHFYGGRYNKDLQARCAGLAAMGAVAVQYDLFAWGESELQFKGYHQTSLANTVQAVNTERILDYMLSQKYIDPKRVGITGGSGGGSHSMLMAAIDDRFALSVPTVMMSAIHYGGCPCESGNPIHLCGNGTNNVEIAAIFAPKPQLIISDGGDWTANVPNLEFPFLARTYGFYQAKDEVKNVHFPNEKHDYGASKRTAMYRFVAEQFGLDASKVFNKNGELDESFFTPQSENELKALGDNGEKLPANAINYVQLRKLIVPRYQIGVIDLMILKRQKLSAFPLAEEIGADGLEVDMGGLGKRPTFESKFSNDSLRNLFVETSVKHNQNIVALAMTGYYAQSLAEKETAVQSVKDCIDAMVKMNVTVGFLPLGVQCDLVKYPEKRDAVVSQLKKIAKYAEANHVVIAIETALDAAGDKQLLKEIGSDNIKISFNIASPIRAGRDLYAELQTLGTENIAQIHASNGDGVWLQNDPQVDMPKLKETLDNMGWSGWLIIERSRDANDVRNVRGNFGANVKYMKSIFQD